jgi:hypothetical protein
MLAAVFLLAAAPKYDVAFIARFYNKPTDKRISKEQVYVCDITGKHRKQLTKDGSQRESVRWVSSTKLAWTEWREADSRLVLFDLDSDKSRVLLRTTSKSRIDRVSWSSVDARPVFLVDDKIAFVEANGSIEWSQPIKYEVGGLPHGVSKWQIPGQPEVQHLGWIGADGKIVPDQPQNQDLVTRVLSRGDKQVQVVLPAAAFGIDLYPGFGKDTVWIVASEGGGSAGSCETMSQIDWATGKSRTVLSDLCSILLSTNERYWVALAPWRNLSKYGKDKQVWTKSAYAGDLKTGTRWTIATGLVNVMDIALRPEMR